MKIKFKVWDKILKKMIDYHSFLSFDNPEYVFLPYSGVNDTEGNEIYLGDVLTSNFAGAEPQNVIFEDGKFTVDNITVGCECLSDEISQCGGHRVIGNIYEKQ
jgi:hypothetical protein